MSESAQPIVNDLNRPFWDGAEAGRLMLPHCVATGQAFWPPSPISPYPAGRAVEWREVAGQGTVLASVVCRRGFQKAFADLLPYGIAMIALDCGPRLQAHVEAPDAPDAPKAGSRVMLCFKALLEGGPPLLVIAA
jgi:uncharacterized OB-fold protein